MNLLIDVGSCCDSHTDEMLEDLFYKAASEPPDDSVWAPHENPYIARMIELFTERGLSRIERVRVELGEFLRGERHRQGELGVVPPAPPGAMRRWSPDELKVVKLYLESLPREAFRLEDWMMVVDYLVQRYLPDDDMRSEAEWLSVRSVLAGRVQAGVEAMAAQPPTLDQVNKVVTRMPLTLVGAREMFEHNAGQQAVMKFGRERCAQACVNLSEGMRRRLKSTILRYQEAEFLGDRSVTAESLQTRLLDDFGALNRDWRRIALTEAGENANQGMIASAAPGTRMKRVEQYRGACSFCRKIDGRVFEVVDPAADPKDPETQVWAGKNNIGRSASPRRREGGVLIDRAPSELWWPAAGVQHPHCRGVWIMQPSRDMSKDPDPEFTAWARQYLAS